MAMDLVDLDALPEGGDHRVCRRGQYLRLGPALCGLGLPGGNGPGNRHPGRRHHLDPGRTITGTEAAVLLDRAFMCRMWPDTGALEEGPPAWAWQSVVNLEAVGVLTPENDGSLPITGELTRGQAAEMLQSAIEVLDFRKNFFGKLNL